MPRAQESPDRSAPSTLKTTAPKEVRELQPPARAERSRRTLGSSALRALGAVLLTLLLAGCAGEFDTVGEALRLLQPTLPDAIVGEPYEQQIHATGGLRPYTFELDAGGLPSGITLQNGALRGTATEVGQYDFSIAVSDGNLNKTVQEYRLTVTEVPPPTFTLAPPQTEVREAVTLRASVAGARNLAAVRALVSWDPASFSLRPGSVITSGRDVAVLLDESDGQLQVDLAFLGRTLDGDHTLFSFVLEPLVEPATLWLDQRVEFLNRGPDPDKHHYYVSQGEGSRTPMTPGDPSGENRQETDEELDPPNEEPDEDLNGPNGGRDR